MKGQPVVRQHGGNTITVVFPVIGARMQWCPLCDLDTDHALLGRLLVMCTLCREVTTR